MTKIYNVAIINGGIRKGRSVIDIITEKGYFELPYSKIEDIFKFKKIKNIKVKITIPPYNEKPPKKLFTIYDEGNIIMDGKNALPIYGQNYGDCIFFITYLKN